MGLRDVTVKVKDIRILRNQLKKGKLSSQGVEDFIVSIDSENSESEYQTPESEDQTSESDDQTPAKETHERVQTPECNDQTTASNDQTPDRNDQTPEIDDQTLAEKTKVIY